MIADFEVWNHPLGEGPGEDREIKVLFPMHKVHATSKSGPQKGRHAN